MPAHKQRFELVIIDVDEGVHWRLLTEHPDTGPMMIAAGDAPDADGAREEAHLRADFYVAHYLEPAVRETRERFDIHYDHDPTPSRKMYGVRHPVHDGAISPQRREHEPQNSRSRRAVA